MIHRNSNLLKRYRPLHYIKVHTEICSSSSHIDRDVVDNKHNNIGLNYRELFLLLFKCLNKQLLLLLLFKINNNIYRIILNYNTL